MLHVPTVVNPTTISLTGRRLAYLNRGRTASQRAAFAAQLVLGELDVIEPTLGQACALAGANPAYVRCLLRANRKLRLDVEAGLVTITDLRGVTDEDLQKLVRKAGTERVWNALCAAL